MPTCFGITFSENWTINKDKPVVHIEDIQRRSRIKPTTRDSNQSIHKHPKTSQELDVIKRAISQNEFLKNILNDKQIELIAEAMFPEEVHEQETIIQEGDEGSLMYVSHFGTFWVVINNKKVNSFSHPTIFGELAVLYKAKRMATIKAMSKGKVWVIHRDVYQQILIQEARQHENELITFLKNVPNVNKLSEDKLKTITQILKTEFFPPDTVIVREGEIGDKFYIIHAGAASVTREIEGKVADLAKGAFFGERALFEQNDRRQATVTAQNPGAECLTLTRTQFLEYFDQNVFDRPIGDDEVKSLDRVQEDIDIERLELSDLKTHATLGVGGFGRVDLVYRETNKNHTFALKYLKKADIVDQNQIPHVFNEKDIQIKCNTTFVVRLHKTYKDRKYLYFLMEPCMGGDLWALLGKQKGRKFTESAARFYTACVLEALTYLHDRKCVYRDLKPENLLLDSKGYLKLTDFGFAKSIGTRQTYTFAGTPEYVAPEIILNRGHDKSADFWTLGIFIFELLVGNTPFKTNDPSYMKTYQLILRGIANVNFPKWMSNHSIEIVRKLCKPVPTDRLGCQRGGANDIRKHRWFDAFEWEKLAEKKLKPPFVPKLSNSLDCRYFETYKPDDDIPPDILEPWDSSF
ncbi:hypothetical protein Trydic_g14949 [Trypoxylus dichotomus]